MVYFLEKPFPPPSPPTPGKYFLLFSPGSYLCLRVAGKHFLKVFFAEFEIIYGENIKKG